MYVWRWRSHATLALPKWRGYATATGRPKNAPYADPGLLNGVRYPAVAFVTRTYLCLTILYHMFVVNGVKVVPLNIYECLHL